MCATTMGAIYDATLKEWIISEPEMRNLIMAFDGLWDKVYKVVIQFIGKFSRKKKVFIRPNHVRIVQATDQEAVDVVSKNCDFIKSCIDLLRCLAAEIIRMI